MGAPKVYQQEMRSLAYEFKTTGQRAARRGEGLVERALETLGPVEQYYRGLAEGGAEETARLLAPQLRKIDEAFKRTEESLRRRLSGAQLGAAIANLERSKAEQVGDLLSQARLRGLEGLTSMASQYGSLGASQLGLGTNLQGTALRTFDELARMDMLRKASTMQALGGLGTVVGYGLGRLFGSRGHSTARAGAVVGADNG